MEIFNKKKLLRSLNDDMATYDELMGYVPTLNATMEELDDSIQWHDDDTFKRKVHSLKEVAGTLYFERFAQTLRRLEFAYVEDREEFFTPVEMEWQLVKKLLDIDTNSKV